ncbi:hypothetical protein ABT224_07045 [Streptomyces sp. NPDC001584]|uniref:hypothetical protein n=1 Tax=Streptomyces sp. NPDC001584 TaxID=3154521 RepID=UPI0033169BEF
MFSSPSFPLRYRSEGGAIVTVDSYKAQCDGCHATDYGHDDQRIKWAEAHSLKCRALPRR